jgi:hypothetical protein
MTSARRIATFLILTSLTLALGACRHASAADPAVERCLDCHAGLEAASPSHDGCVPCHGGNPSGRTKDEGHRGIYGLADRSYAGRWEKGCGDCHRHQLERLRSSQMYTNAGMIAQIQATWEGERDSVVYSARGARLHDTAGLPLAHTSVVALDNLSGDLYRKFCARCHVAKQNDADDGAGHAAGCAACHFPYADDAAYHGGDPTMKGLNPHSRTHAMAGLPPLEACTRCHQRSGRVALAYQGLNDGNNGLVPTKGGLPGPLPASDQRSYSHIAPDVHFAAGMECIDCHTSREVMGDGYAAPGMHGQLEIACEDCHGGGLTGPRFATAWREHELPVRESRQYGRPLPAGARVALTSKGRPYSNVFDDDGRVGVMLKRDGRILRSPVITGTAAHTIAGHERLECHTCHSRTVVQCYGCHTTYDQREYGWDYLAGRATRGSFSETEDVRALYPFPLALNMKGRIGTVTPGCQTFINVIEEDGTRSRDEDVASFRGRKQLRFAPFFGHNVGTRAVGCAECHGNPAFLGFGQHVVERGLLRGTLLCEKDGRKPLDGFLHEDQAGIAPHAAMSREGARPLDQTEARRVFAVNLCLICHDQAMDPIYRKPLDYHALDDTLHRRLLAAGR